jgi:3-mercaptopyruvate sulfurtransferase SseA
LKHLLIAAAAAALTAGIAGAQYKTQPQPHPSTGPIQIQQNGQQAGTEADELAKARRISRDEAMRLVKQNKAIYVDVRSKDSYDMGHLPGAISVPLSTLQAHFKDLPLGKLLITYCA